VRRHELKTDPEPFGAVWSGHKRAEFRRDDRPFEVGDDLLLREFDQPSGAYSGREVVASITHIIRGSESRYGIPEGFAMLSVRANWRGTKWQLPSGLGGITETPVPEVAR
jgi:hypothetical protein